MRWRSGVKAFLWSGSNDALCWETVRLSSERVDVLRRRTEDRGRCAVPGRDAARVTWRNGVEAFLEGDPDGVHFWETVGSKRDGGSSEVKGHGRAGVDHCAHGRPQGRCTAFSSLSSLFRRITSIDWLPHTLSPSFQGSSCRV